MINERIKAGKSTIPTNPISKLVINITPKHVTPIVIIAAYGKEVQITCQDCDKNPVGHKYFYIYDISVLIIIIHSKAVDREHWLPYYWR
jgi:hypothetical protein